MSIYTDLGLTTTESASIAAKANTSSTGTYSLSQADFLSLLTTELAYQDPTKPTDNNEMVSQMAQITMVDGITSLNSTVGSLSDVVTSSQALMASGLVGQSVLLDSNIGFSSGSGFSGIINAGEDSVSNLTISVLDEAGSLVYQAASDGILTGDIPFSWDGTSLDGTVCANGMYRIMANGIVNGVSTTIGSNVYGKVQSVVLGTGTSATTLNLEGLGSVSLDEVKQIAN